MFSKLDLHLSRSGPCFIFGCVDAPSPFRQPSCSIVLTRGAGRSALVAVVAVPTRFPQSPHVVGSCRSFFAAPFCTLSTAKGRCLLPPGSPDRWPCFVLGRCHRHPQWRPHLTTQDSTFGAHFMAPQSAGLIALHRSRASPRRFLPLAVVSSYFQLSPLFNRSPTMALICGDF